MNSSGKSFFHNFSKWRLPAASHGVSGGLKQFELYIMKLFIVPTISLFLYILADNIFIAAFAYCIYVLSIGPKFSTPQILFDWWDSTKYFACCYAFYSAYYFCGTIRRHRLDQKVNMVLVCSYLHKMHLVTFRYVNTNIFQYLVNFVWQNYFSVFAWADYMIQQHWNVMALMDIYTHPAKIAP